MTSPRARRLRWLVPGVVAIALVVVGGVAWARADTRPHAEAGQLFDPAFLQDELGIGADVVLPWVRAEVTVGQPRDELPDALGAEPNLQAPDGGGFVQVQVNIDNDNLIPLYVDAPGVVGRADLVLTDGDHRYPLTHVPGGLHLDAAAPETGVLQRFLAVEGSPEHWSLEVEYDGETWVVDLDDGSSEPGPHDALAEIPAVDEQQQPAQRCGEPRWSSGFSPAESYNEPKCQVIHQMRVPYVDGLGWAEPGREFLVVQVESYEPGFARSRGGDVYLVRDPAMSYRLDGRVPLAVAEVNDLSALGGPLALQLPYDPDQAIFDVAADEPTPVLQVRQSLVGEADEPGVPQAPRIHVDWRVPLEGA